MVHHQGFPDTGLGLRPSRTMWFRQYHIFNGHYRTNGCIIIIVWYIIRSHAYRVRLAILDICNKERNCAMKQLIMKKRISAVFVVSLIIVAMVCGGISVDAAYATKAPAKAKLMKVSNAAKGVKLTWKRSAGATGYVIYRKSGSGSYKKIATVKKSQTLNYTDKKVKNTGKYTYRIRAYKRANGSSAYGAFSKGKTICFVARPVLKSVALKADMTPAIAYKANKKAAGYQIKLTAANGTSQVMSLKKFEKTALAPNVVYSVQLRAIYKNGKKKYRSAWSAAQTVADDAGTVYFASDVSDFMKTSVKGAGYTKGAGSDAIPDAFVVSGDALAGLSDSDAILSLRTCLAGNLLAIDAPTFAQLDAFWDRTEKILDSDPSNEEYEYLKAETELSNYTLNELLESYAEENEYTASNNEHVFDSIGMSRGQVYFVHDIDQVITEDTGLTYTAVSSLEGTIQGQGASLTAMASDGDDEWEEVISKTSGCYSQWMRDAASYSATSDIDDLQKAQTCTYSMTVRYGNTNMGNVDPAFLNELLTKKEVVQVHIDVWTACDIADQQEYWLIRTSATCNNQDLGYTERGSNYNNTPGGCVGPYFHEMDIKESLKGGVLRTNDCNPKTSVGSGTFTSGSSFTLGGNIGMTMAGPTGGLNAGYSVSSSRSVSISDISVAQNADLNDNNVWSGSTSQDAAWSFTAPVFNPEVSYTDGWWVYEEVKPIQKNTATFDTHALYTRSSSDDPNSSNGWLWIDTNTTLAALEYWQETFGRYTDEHYFSQGVYHHIPFNRPNNLCGEYIMTFTPPADTSVTDRSALNDVLAKSFQGWGTKVNYYAYGDVNNKFVALDPVAKNTFAGVRQKIKTNQNVLKDQGFSGTYEFYIQNVSTGQKVDSFTLTF